MAPTKVLVVEDDPEMQGFYARFFDRHVKDGLHFTLVADAERALRLFPLQAVDLAVLDWNLPGLSGAALAKAMRTDSRTRTVGIIMVTGRSSAQDVIMALEAGADDHLGKPFDEGVLLARIRSLARRSRLLLGQSAAKRFPGLEIDLEGQRLSVDGRPLPLTPREFDLVRVFLQRPEIVHSREYLWETLWGYESDQWHHVLISTLSSLRRKLGPVWGARLKTLRGLGYRFDPPL